MKIHNTINMCEQKCMSEQYSNRANLLKRKIEGILKNVHVYLENSHFRSLWSNRYQQCISQTGTTQTAGARNKGGNFIGQLCISVVPIDRVLRRIEHKGQHIIAQT